MTREPTAACRSNVSIRSPIAVSEQIDLDPLGTPTGARRAAEVIARTF